MTMTQRILAAITLTGALVLSGCGGDDDEPTAEPTPESTDTPTEDLEPEESGEPEAAAPAGDLTPAGSELALGESATLPFTFGTDAEAVVEFTVDAIEQGEPSDLDELDLGDRAAGLVPYYIRFTVVGGEGGDTLPHSSVDGVIHGLLPDGSRAQSLSVIGSWDPCSGSSLPADFTVGSSFEACTPYLAPEASEVAAAHFALSDTDYDYIDGEPVVWQD